MMKRIYLAVDTVGADLTIGTAKKPRHGSGGGAEVIGSNVQSLRRLHRKDYPVAAGGQ